MTKAPTLSEKSKRQRDNIKNATINFDYTTIVDRLKTISWSNSSHPTGVVKPVYERSTFPLTKTFYIRYVDYSSLQIHYKCHLIRIISGLER